MKKVLITGASSGIGLQLARDYAQDDAWEVFACGRDREKLEKALGDCKVNLCVFDINSQTDCEQALTPLGNLDLVILNAGVCEYIDDPSQFDAALFSRVIQTNLIGTVNCLAPLIKLMKPNGRLGIVSSAVTFLPLTRSEAYGASKAALDYLTRTLAIDLAPRGIQVSLIRPGFVDTPLTQRNNFSMPFIVSLPEASQAIRQGLSKGKSEIAFPRLFIYWLRFLSCLPQRVWFHIAVKMVRVEP